jgi:hypothetical protein
MLQWRLLAPEQRPVDPYGTATQAQAADLIIRPDMNEYEPSTPMISTRGIR